MLLPRTATASWLILSFWSSWHQREMCDDLFYTVNQSIALNETIKDIEIKCWLNGTNFDVIEILNKWEFTKKPFADIRNVKIELSLTTFQFKIAKRRYKVTLLVFLRQLIPNSLVQTEWLNPCVSVHRTVALNWNKPFSLHCV